MAPGILKIGSHIKPSQGVERNKLGLSKKSLIVNELRGLSVIFLHACNSQATLGVCQPQGPGNTGRVWNDQKANETPEYRDAATVASLGLADARPEELATIPNNEEPLPTLGS